jgi:glycosyltransferase involved in cell wall biosynthesis
MACGLPAIATEVTIAPDVITRECGRLEPAGNVEALVASFEWFGENRGLLPSMSISARGAAESFTWERYRRCVSNTVASLM